MAKPIIVVAVLALVAVVLLAALDWEGGPVPVDTVARSADPEHTGRLQSEPVRGSREPVIPAREPLDVAGAAGGGVWIGIGDTYTFGGEVLPRRDLVGEAFDIYCQDMRHEVSLECPSGAVPAVRPLSSVGLPGTAASAAAILPEAPLHLPERNLTLTEEPSLQLPGIGFVKSASGSVYRLHVEELRGHPDALQRRAFIRFERVPQTERGGVLQLPVDEGTVAPGADTPYLLHRAVSLGHAIPGDSFASYIDAREHTTLERLDSDLAIEGEHLIIKDSLEHDVQLARGSLIVEKDIEAGATVELDNSAGLIVGGDVAGMIRNSGYAFMYIRGSLGGEMTHDSYATGIIEGDVIGTLHIDSYSDVLIRGRLLGTLDVKGSCWSTVYIESFMSRQQLVDMTGDFHQITLHLASSDLLPGQHEDIGTWRTVVVGDPVWSKLLR